MKKVFEASTILKKRSIVAIFLAVTVGAICLIFGIYSISNRTNPISGVVFIFIGLMQFLWAWITLSTIRNIRLVTTPEKLEFHSPGLELITTWDNLERIGRMAAKASQYDSLVLRNPATQKTSILFQLFRRQPEKEIPLSMFSNWRMSEMGQEIKKYAPHLFLDSGDSK